MCRLYSHIQLLLFVYTLFAYKRRFAHEAVRLHEGKVEFVPEKTIASLRGRWPRLYTQDSGLQNMQGVVFMAKQVASAV